MLRTKTGALALATTAASLGLIFGPIGAANAATNPDLPNSSYGFDGNAHLIVGGGSTTLYKIATGFASLWNSTTSCQTNNSQADPFGTSNPSYPQAGTGTSPAGPAYNQCTGTSGTQSYTGINAGGNYDGDTVAIASPAGSSTGIGSLNGDVKGTAGTFAYEGTNETINTGSGTANGFGTVDFALSSRGPKLTGGNCPGGDELTCDTFWGVAADGVEVFTWGSTVSGTADDTQLGGLTNDNGFSGLTFADLANIWDCTWTTWGQLPYYSEAVTDGLSVPPSAAPLVPWSMNSNSGTYADFDGYVDSSPGNSGFVADTDAGLYGPSTSTNPTPPSGKCVRELSTSSTPLENDIKPLLEDVQTNYNSGAGLSTNPLSTNNPANWLWFGSYGLLSAYQYLSQPSLYGNQYNTYAAPINGATPSTSGILAGTYTMPRTLSVVTAKADADCPYSGSTCSFTGGTTTNTNGTADLPVSGGTSGKSGAIREFVRFLCRTKAENEETVSPAVYAPTDPYTGVADYTEIGSVISGSGFTAIPVASRSPGSACYVNGAPAA